MNKHKVINDYGINISLNFENLDGRVINILPNSFSYITEDQLLYLTHSSDILKKGTLRLEKDTRKINGNEEIKNLDAYESIKNDKNLFSDERLNELINLSIEDLKKEIKDCDNLLGLQKLLEEAEKRENPKGYIKVLKAKISELM